MMIQASFMISDAPEGSVAWQHDLKLTAPHIEPGLSLVLLQNTTELEELKEGKKSHKSILASRRL